MKKKERGSYESYDSDSSILVCAWKDNRTVTIASNNVEVDSVTAAKIWSVSDKKKSIRFPQPKLKHLYNQNISQYRISIRGKMVFVYSIILY